MRHPVFSLGLALLLFATGCGESRPRTVPVTGLVTLDGEPVADASITFYPENGRPATGRTDAEGIYTLTTFETNDGAVPGQHRVSISKQTIPESNSTEDLEAIKSEVPEVYSNADTSGLKAEVVAGQDAPIDFNLAE